MGNVVLNIAIKYGKVGILPRSYVVVIGVRETCLASALIRHVHISLSSHESVSLKVCNPISLMYSIPFSKNPQAWLILHCFMERKGV